MYVWDIISLLVFALVAYPVIRYVETIQNIYLIICIGLIFCMIVIKLTRMLPTYHNIMLRPEKAQNCNIMNKGGCYKGKIGLPSGHALIATYVLTCLMLIQPSTIKTIIGSTLIVLIGLSRYYKSCHTPLQIVLGIVLGGTFGLFTIKKFLR